MEETAKYGLNERTESPEQLLKRIFGYSEFREGQKTVIDGVLAGRDVLCVMPTGAGKSVCYQIPAMIFGGITLVISPLISLMKDQVSALRQSGISAGCLNSAQSPEEYAENFARFVNGEFRLVYVAPERLEQESFREVCRNTEISFIAVDEAHCISQWGQDFRPGYLRIPGFIACLNKRPPVGAFTATATPEVRADIIGSLKLADPVTAVNGFDRPNLSFTVCEPRDKDARLLELLRDRYRQSGIVYCGTRKNVEEICALLCREGFPATRYHAGLTREERTANQEDFLFDRKTVMVATNAFGMGIDKSNVSYVIHYNMPQSLEAYYQEAGRAGRDGCRADCILLYSGQDVILAKWLIDHQDPNPDLSPKEQEAVRDRNREKLKKMTFWAKSRRCYRAGILRYFGEMAPDTCGNCSNCVPNCESVDITMEAQMILSCVARTAGCRTEQEISDILLGTETVPETDLDLTTFGLMTDTDPAMLRAEISTLCEQGYLDRDPENTRILKLNEASRTVLFRDQRVMMKLVTAERTVTEVDEALLKELKYLRLRLASAEGVAGFVLFSDAVLQEICRKRPQNLTQLAEMEGMGEYKANRFGEQILEAVRKHTRPEKKTGISRHSAKKTVKGVSYREDLIQKGKTEAYQSWSRQEEDQLTAEFRSGRSVREMADKHRRTGGAIRSRLKKLKLTD